MKALTVLGLFLIASISALAQNYSFGVKVVGHGKPVILIPGLTCTGDVWDGTVEQLKGKYECHVLTLPGFGKQAPIDGPYLSHVRDDIIAYVKDKKLNHPNVIGHSLGGFMVYYLAEAEPKLWGRMIAVDGLPFLPLLFSPTATPEDMKPIAEMMSKQMATSKPDQFKASVKQSLTSEITDAKNVDAMYVYCQEANQADTAEAMKELLTIDLRGQLSTIKSQVLLIGAGQQATTDESKKKLQDMYEAQVQSIPAGRVKMAWKCRHFVMLDDPAFFYQTVQDFLAVGS